MVNWDNITINDTLDSKMYSLEGLSYKALLLILVCLYKKEGG